MHEHITMLGRYSFTLVLIAQQLACSGPGDGVSPVCVRLGLVARRGGGVP